MPRFEYPMFDMTQDNTIEAGPEKDLLSARSVLQGATKLISEAFASEDRIDHPYTPAIIAEGLGGKGYTTANWRIEAALQNAASYEYYDKAEEHQEACSGCDDPENCCFLDYSDSAMIPFFDHSTDDWNNANLASHMLEWYHNAILYIDYVIHTGDALRIARAAQLGNAYAAFGVNLKEEN